MDLSRQITEIIVLYKLFLLGDSGGFTTPSSRLCVLSANSETPEMSETTMAANLLQPLQILALFVVHIIGQQVHNFTVFVVLVAVEEPVGDLKR